MHSRHVEEERRKGASRPLPVALEARERRPPALGRGSIACPSSLHPRRVLSCATRHQPSGSAAVKHVGASSSLPSSVVHDVVGKRKEVEPEINMKRRNGRLLGGLPRALQ
jgi:hypothetical protein